MADGEIARGGVNWFRGERSANLRTSLGSLFQREGAACENDRVQNLREDVTGGRLRARCEDDRVGP